MGLQVAASLQGSRFWAINLPKYTDLCSVDNIWELTTFYMSPALNHTLHRLKSKVKMIKLGRREIPDSSRKAKIRAVAPNLTNLGGFLPCFLWFANSCRNDLMFVSILDVFGRNVYPSLSFSFSSVYFYAKWKIITPTYITIQNLLWNKPGMAAWPISQCLDLAWLAPGQQR